MQIQTLAPEFSYASLESEARIVVQQRTSEIKTLVRRSAQDALEIGAKLLEVKNLLGHGHFGEWLGCEFGWSWQTANNYMMVAAKFQNFGNLDQIAPSALYLLAADSTPEDVKQNFIEQAEAGEKVTHKAVKAALTSAKPREGEKLTVIEPEHPLHGATVIAKKIDGDIIHCETPEGVQPLAFGWLGTEAELAAEPEILAPAKPAPPKTSLSELLESTELALEISRERCERLQDFAKRLCDAVQLPPHLQKEAVQLGIL